MPRPQKYVIVDGTKLCRKCQTWRPVEKFSADKSTACGLNYECRDCINSNRVPQPGRHFKQRYGITLEEYTAMLNAQGGLCAICNNPPSGGRNPNVLVVDHCHATGEVRALLCSPCNTMLGAAKDDIETLKQAISYLNRN